MTCQKCIKRDVCFYYDGKGDTFETCTQFISDDYEKSANNFNALEKLIREMKDEVRAYKPTETELMWQNDVESAKLEERVRYTSWLTELIEKYKGAIE